MMPPQEFRARIISHNRHAVAAALLCLLGAWVGWILVYVFLVGLTLGFFTIVQGQEVIAGEKLTSLPVWLHPTAAVLAGFLLLWAAFDQWISRYKPLRDRPPIGWHIFSDVVLILPRLTFGIWNHLASMIHLNREAQGEAFMLLCHIYEEKKCWRASLGAEFPDARKLPRLLAALQLLGWIDLHRGDDDWFYIIPSDEGESVALMVAKAKKEDAA